MTVAGKLFSLLAILSIVLFTSQAFAWDPPPSPKPQSAISDVSGVLTQTSKARLDAKLLHINSGTANELAALIVPSLEGMEISELGSTTFKAWGVGKKDIDNGVLVVIAMKEHKSRIEVGRGVEGDLPDLKSNDILRNVLAPYMKRGDVEGGLGSTFDAISSSIANHKAEVAREASHQSSCSVSAVGSDTGNFSGFLGLGLFVLCGILGVIAVRKIRANLEKNRLTLLELEERNIKLREKQRRAKQLKADQRALEDEKHATQLAKLAEETKRTAYKPIPVTPHYTYDTVSPLTYPKVTVVKTPEVTKAVLADAAAAGATVYAVSDLLAKRNEEVEIRRQLKKERRASKARAEAASREEKRRLEARVAERRAEVEEAERQASARRRRIAQEEANRQAMEEAAASAVEVSSYSSYSSSSSYSDDSSSSSSSSGDSGSSSDDDGGSSMPDFGSGDCDGGGSSSDW